MITYAKRILSILLILTMLMTVLPTALADGTDSGGETPTPIDHDGIVLTKTLVDGISEGQPKRIKLEAYVTAGVSREHQNLPTDIILVLDQSGSMDNVLEGDESRLDVMKAAVKNFVDQVAALNKELDNTHYRVAIVGFASESGHGDNTEILTTTSTSYRLQYVEISRNDLDTSETYYIRGGYDSYSAIKYFEATSGGGPGGGRQAGWYTLNKNGNPDRRVGDNTQIYKTVATEVESVGKAYNSLATSDYEEALIYCTEAEIADTGEIGKAVNAIDAEGATRTDLGMEMAENIFANQPEDIQDEYEDGTRKQMVVMITDGVPTTQSAFSSSVANDAITAARNMKSEGAYVFSLYIGTPDTNSRAFMQSVSSNYPSAGEDGDVFSGSGDSVVVDYDNMGTQFATTFYSAHTSSAAIGNVFSNIVSTITVDANLSAGSVIRDTITEYFRPAVITNGSYNPEQVLVYTSDCLGPNAEDGELEWDTEVRFNDATVTITPNETTGESVVDVYGFPFAINAVTETPKDGENGTDYGRKLVIYIPIVENENSDNFGGYLPTNPFVRGAEIYEKPTDTSPVETAVEQYDDTPINYSINPAERIRRAKTEYGTEHIEPINYEENLVASVFDEMIDPEFIPDGKNNVGVTMSYVLVDIGTHDRETEDDNDKDDDVVIARLTVKPGVAVDVTDKDNWTWIVNESTITIPAKSYFGEKVYVLMCTLTSTNPVENPNSYSTYNYLDMMVLRDGSNIVYGVIDNGGTLTVEEDAPGTLNANTYTETVTSTSSGDGVTHGNSAVMKFAPLAHHSISEIRILTESGENADSWDTMTVIYGNGEWYDLEEAPMYIMENDNGEDVWVELNSTNTARRTAAIDDITAHGGYESKFNDSYGSWTFYGKVIDEDIAVEVYTIPESYTLTTHHDEVTEIAPSQTFTYHADEKLPVYFMAHVGSYVTSLTLKDGDNDDITYDLTTGEGRTDLQTYVTGLGGTYSFTTDNGYDSNGNPITIVTGGTIYLPRTQDYEVSVTGTTRYYQLTYQYFKQTAPGMYSSLVAAPGSTDDKFPDEVSYVPYGEKLTDPEHNPGYEHDIDNDEIYYTLSDWFENHVDYGGDHENDPATPHTAEFTGAVDPTTLTMPAKDLTLYSYFAKNPDVKLEDLTVVKEVSQSHTEDAEFTFTALIAEATVGTLTLTVEAGETEVSGTLSITLNDAQMKAFEKGTKIYLYELQGEDTDVWRYDTSHYELVYTGTGEEKVPPYNLVHVSTAGERTEIETGGSADFLNTYIYFGELDVEKQVTKIDNTEIEYDANGNITTTLPEVGKDTVIQWTITVTNTGNAPCMYTLADSLTYEDGEDELEGITVTDSAGAEVDEASEIEISPDTTHTYTATYTVTEDDAAKSLVNTASAVSKDSEDEDEADPVDVAPYTVIYVDGVEDEEVFADQKTENLLYGDKTPAFEGTPSREGYTFTGWSPEVADTVTKNAVYTAQWLEDEKEPTVDPIEPSPVYVIKTAEQSTAEVGDRISYVIRVFNGSDSEVDVVVKDPMLGVYEEISLEPYGYRTLTYYYTVKEGDVGRTLYNTVIIEDEEGNELDRDTSGGTEIIVPVEIEETIFPNIPDRYVVAALNTDDHFAYIVGYSDGTVKPNNPITRAEVATIFFRLMTDESREAYWSNTNTFDDVSADKWYNNAISTLQNAGILDGTSFRPDENITRAELAVIATRFSQMSNTNVGSVTFTDVQGHWAQAEIEYAAAIGWVKGYSDGTFRPDQQITRAEAMTLINRVLERAVKEDGMEENMVVWPDNTPDAWYYEDVQEATNSHYYVRAKNQPVEGYDFNYEVWRGIMEPRDWTELEKSWAAAASGKTVTASDAAVILS